MLIGAKSTFAIESELRETIDTFVYCNFRFWIAGEPIGDWDEQLVLGVLMRSSDVFMRFQGARQLEAGNSMSSELLWQHIIKVANSDDPNDLHTSLEGRYRQRYLLHEIASDSVATACDVIVVDRIDGVQRLLWKKNTGVNTQEITLPELTVDKVVANFLDWANTQQAGNQNRRG